VEMQSVLYCFAVGVVLLMLAPPTASFSHGASTTSCQEMIPGHIQAQPQDLRHSHVTLRTSASSYLPGQLVTVTVRSSRDFMGFLLQARSSTRVGMGPVGGSWPLMPPGTHTLRCLSEGDTLTHSDKQLKRNLSFVWRAPDAPKGDIRFYITVVQSYFVYWAGIESAVVRDGTRGLWHVISSTERPVSALQENITPHPSSPTSEWRQTTSLASLRFSNLAPTFTPDDSNEKNLNFQIKSQTTNPHPAFFPSPPPPPPPPPSGPTLHPSPSRTSSPSSIIQTPTLVSIQPSLRSTLFTHFSSSSVENQPKSVPALSVLPSPSPISTPPVKPSTYPETSSNSSIYPPSTLTPAVVHAYPNPEPHPNLDPNFKLNLGHDLKSNVPNSDSKPKRPPNPPGTPDKEGKYPDVTPRHSAWELGMLLGCSAGLGMLLVVGVRYIYRQACGKQTEVTLNARERERGLIHVQECGDLVRVRKIRENSFVLLAEYDILTSPGD
uniref:Reeler domain containing 1 n=1 Tax=Echeneis naucrates TaxID=173247 RepID=A0A665T9L4_ECHNA